MSAESQKWEFRNLKLDPQRAAGFSETWSHLFFTNMITAMYRDTRVGSAILWRAPTCSEHRVRKKMSPLKFALKALGEASSQAQRALRLLLILGIHRHLFRHCWKPQSQCCWKAHGHSKCSVTEEQNHSALKDLSLKNWREQMMDFASWYLSMLQRNSLCRKALLAPKAPATAHTRGETQLLQNLLDFWLLPLVLWQCQWLYKQFLKP